MPARVPYAARSVAAFKLSPELVDILQTSGKVRLAPALRRTLEREVEVLVLRELQEAGGQPAQEVREQLDDVDAAARALRRALGRCGEDALVALHRASRNADVGDRAQSLIVDLTLAVHLTRGPPGVRQPSIIRALVYRLGPIFQAAGGRIGTSTTGPFQRFVQAVHSALPIELRHQGGIAPAIRNAVLFLRSHYPEWAKK